MDFVKTEHNLQAFKVVAIDCEMCVCESGSEVTRISLVDEKGALLLDEYVRPDSKIIDYATKHSGVTPAHLEHCLNTLSSMQQRFKEFVGLDTILIGHSVYHDLKCLKIYHTKLIDTSLIFHSPKGPPFRPSLKYLAERYLDQIIQNSPLGHNSVEDAAACAQLVQLKLSQGLS